MRCQKINVKENNFILPSFASNIQNFDGFKNPHPGFPLFVPIVCERINKIPALGDLVVPREMKDSKLEQDCQKRINLISAKLDELNVRAGIGLAATGDTAALFDNNI